MISELDKTNVQPEERESGYPQPHLYDQHYINKYAYPKGLKCAGRREDRDSEDKKSLYDIVRPQNRKGFSGWKLTKRAEDLAAKQSLSPRRSPRGLETSISAVSSYQTLAQQSSARHS